MDSEEAIMENENNSNLESQSNMREQMTEGRPPLPQAPPDRDENSSANINSRGSPLPPSTSQYSDTARDSSEGQTSQLGGQRPEKTDETAMVEPATSASGSEQDSQIEPLDYETLVGGENEDSGELKRVGKAVEEDAPVEMCIDSATDSSERKVECGDSLSEVTLGEDESLTCSGETNDNLKEQQVQELPENDNGDNNITAVTSSSSEDKNSLLPKKTEVAGDDAEKMELDEGGTWEDDLDLLPDDEDPGQTVDGDSAGHTVSEREEVGPVTGSLEHGSSHCMRSEERQKIVDEEMGCDNEAEKEVASSVKECCMQEAVGQESIEFTGNVELSKQMEDEQVYKDSSTAQGEGPSEISSISQEKDASEGNEEDCPQTVEISHVDTDVKASVEGGGIVIDNQKADSINASTEEMSVDVSSDLVLEKDDERGENNPVTLSDSKYLDAEDDVDMGPSEAQDDCAKMEKGLDEGQDDSAKLETGPIEEQDGSAELETGPSAVQENTAELETGSTMGLHSTGEPETGPIEGRDDNTELKTGSKQGQDAIAVPETGPSEGQDAIAIPETGPSEGQDDIAEPETGSPEIGFNEGQDNTAELKTGPNERQNDIAEPKSGPDEGQDNIGELELGPSEVQDDVADSESGPNEGQDKTAATPTETEVEEESEPPDTEVKDETPGEKMLPCNDEGFAETDGQAPVAPVASSQDAQSENSVVDESAVTSCSGTSVTGDIRMEDNPDRSTRTDSAVEEMSAEISANASGKTEGEQMSEPEVLAADKTSDGPMEDSVTQIDSVPQPNEEKCNLTTAQENVCVDAKETEESEGTLGMDSHEEMEIDQQEEVSSQNEGQKSSSEKGPDAEATSDSAAASEKNESVSDMGDKVDEREMDVSDVSPEADSSVELTCAKQKQSEEESSEPKETSELTEGNGSSSVEVSEDGVAVGTEVNQEVSLGNDSNSVVTTEDGKVSDVNKTAPTDDDDDIEIIDVKKEREETSMDTSASESCVVKSEVKQEPEPKVGKETEPEDDVVVLDDDDDDVVVVPVKAEVAESKDSKAEENGLGIMISSVAGQQHMLHASADNSETSSKPQEKKQGGSKSKSGKSKTHTCIVCQKVGRCKYNIVRNGDVKHLCDDACFKKFRSSPSSFLKYKDPGKKAKDAATTAETKTTQMESSALKGALSSPPGSATTGYKTCVVCQLMNLNTYPFCNWLGLDFCGEACLGRFQANLASTCSFCNAFVPVEMRTVFCLKIGNEVRPFCKSKCYSEFRRMLRLCAFCQKNLSSVPDAVTKTVGGSKTKEFCSKECLKKMEEQFNDVEILDAKNAPVISGDTSLACAVCLKKGAMKHTVRIGDKTSALCSDLCLSAFQYTNKIGMNRCESCGNLCTAEEMQAHFVQFEGQMRHFCSDSCVNRFRVLKTKMVPCSWCSTSKPNFDMIERLDVESKYQLFCSLNCLSLYRVNLQAKSSQAVSCDQCKKTVPAQYHLTMSDASVRNFCSYTCVMAFQAQFAAKPQTTSLGPVNSVAPQRQQQQQQQQPQKAATGGKPRGRMSTRQKSKKNAPAPVAQGPSIPVISSVVSLAPATQKAITLPPVAAAVPFHSNSELNRVPSADAKQHIVVQEPPAKVMKNKLVQCRPLTLTKATSCRPHSQPKEVQTDEIPPKNVAIPIPVPIYIPMPTVMYSAPTPQLVPIPIPIPVPMFIPTTRKSANGILKAIKEIVERMPADPLEAELLMMAEAVALDPKTGDSDTDSEDAGGEDFGGADEEMKPASKEEETVIMRKREGGGEEDMIQMALRMAEEMSGPIEDLESSVEPVAVNTGRLCCVLVASSS
ncbi:uncharacterized protein LOC101855726 isoform X2 [Aplysia californica]|uniref:Uncharacterized protein LOC101855726 isoform X2 n=1 Tax=Aplysia californica TaxID=6500 RepID=A0ABM1VTH8_APLCA|nr:uncharacterized protein LOC101855726 isoform X2 [Aplysia californica]